MTCACGATIGPGLLVCPTCQRLVYSEQLKAHAAKAEADPSVALSEWRQALVLLPPGSRQHAEVRARIAELSHEKPKASGVAGLVAAGGLFLWKLKSLLFGLTKLSTLLSMLLAFGVYWQLWGMWFALGFVLAIYVHEMGHVVALQRRGIAATAPMFIPGLGAFVRLKQYPIDAREDARVGLAGPVWGAGAAVSLWALGLAFEGGIWFALARTTAWINLFNLLPLGSLDGGRGVRPLSRQQRGLVTAVAVSAWAITQEGLLILLALTLAFRSFDKRAPEEGDTQSLVEWGALLAVLSALVMIRV